MTTKAENPNLNDHSSGLITRLEDDVDTSTIVNDFLCLNKPVIVTGLTSGWRALEKWDFSWFETEFGNAFTNVFEKGNEAKGNTLRLRNMFSRIRGGETLYSSWYLKEWLPLLEKDYPLENRILGDPELNWLLELPAITRGEMNVLFIGKAGSGVKNHRDSMGTHLWSAQIIGRKRWIICSPDQSHLIHENHSDWLNMEASVEDFPPFAEARPLDFVLEPGEVLFLPVGWWHQTLLLDDSISITSDIMNESNLPAYLGELDEFQDNDPKIKEFFEASVTLRKKWVARLPQKKTQSIDRLSDITFEQLMNDYLIPRRPLVLMGQASEWPALKKWDTNFFSNNYGNTYIQYFLKQDDLNGRMRMSKYLGTQFDEPHYAMWCLDDYHDLLAEDFAPLGILESNDRDWTMDLPKRDRNALYWIFMGSAGSGIACHSDRLGQHVLSVQIGGRKRWVMHSPEDEPWLYNGKVDLMNPNIEAFPLYANASYVYDFVVGPGDAVILPDGWWHQTLTLEDSISLSHDFMNASNFEVFMERMNELRSKEYMKSAEIQKVVAAWKRRSKSVP